MDKIILGLVGEIASGKGTTAKYLQDKYAGKTHRFSTMLRDVATRMHLEESRENLQKLSTAFRQYFGDDILSTAIYHDVSSDTNALVVIDGIRRYPDIKQMSTLPEFRLVYIEASAENRYKRIIERGENADDKNKTFEEFKKDHDWETEKDIVGLKSKADFIINNDGSLTDLYPQIDKIINELKNK